MRQKQSQEFCVKCFASYLAPTLVALREDIHHLVFANQQHDQKVQQPNGGDQGGYHAEPQPQQDRHCVVRDV